MPFSQDNPLAYALSLHTQFDYPVHSRIHPLRSIPNCYVKREDELGFGISGSKIRKYRTLIPYFVNEKISEVVVIGGANSNHVLGISQLLIENGIKPLLFLRGNKDELFLSPEKELGNLFFLQLFVDINEMNWIPRKDWSDVKQIASKKYPQAFILEEGGSAKGALMGLMTLPLDIEKNEKDHQINLKNIFIDAGTGFTAIALMLGLAFLKRDTKIHLLLLADSQDDFLKKLKRSHLDFENLMRLKCPYPDNFELYEPKNAKSFGSVNQKVLNEIKTVAKTEGFLTDPVYSGKLFFESKRIIEEKRIHETTLIIHSGGGLSLAGFQNKLLQK